MTPKNFDGNFDAWLQRSMFSTDAETPSNGGEAAHIIQHHDNWVLDKDGAMSVSKSLDLLARHLAVEQILRITSSFNSTSV